MPTYEYVCSDCSNEWEEIQKISAPPTRVCPKCHKASAKRQISGGNFILKGGGWYADLYSSPSNKKANESTNEKKTSESSTSDSSRKSSEAAHESSSTSSSPSSGEASTPSASTSSSSPSSQH